MSKISFFFCLLLSILIRANDFIIFKSKDYEIEKLCTEALNLLNNYDDDSEKKVLHYINKAKSLAEGEKNSLDLAKVYTVYFLYYHCHRKTSESIFYLEKANHLLKNTNEFEAKAYLDFYKGCYYRTVFDKASSQNFLMKSYNFFRTTKNEFTRSRISAELANFFIDIDINISEKYLKEIELLYKKNKDNRVLAELLFTKYSINFYKGSPPKEILTDILASINLKKKYGYNHHVFYDYYFASLTYLKNKEIYKAKKFYEYAENHYHKDNVEDIENMIKLKVEILLKENNEAQAIRILTENNSGIKDKRILAFYRKEQYRTLAKIYEKKGNKLKSLESTISYYKLKDSIDSGLLNNNISALNTVYQAEILTKENNELKEKSRNELIISVFLLNLFLLGVLLFIFYAKSQNFKQKLKKEKIRQLELEKTSASTLAELEKKKSQILKLEQQNLIEENLSTKIKFEKNENVLKSIKEKLINDDDYRAIITDNQYFQKKMDFLKPQVEDIDNLFFQKLKAIQSNFSNREIEYCACFYLNYSTKEIADFLSIQENTVRITKYRIKKKLGLGTDENLTNYLRSI